VKKHAADDPDDGLFGTLFLSTRHQKPASHRPVPFRTMAPKRSKRSGEFRADIHATDEMAGIVTPRFLIVSLGNPKPYLDTLHSAGHLALQSLQKLLGGETQPFGGAGGRKGALAAVGHRYTLVQSPAVMNVSGPAVLREWRRYGGTTDARQAGRAPVLVLLHDDLESELGAVRTRRWERSAQGHNGVKSAKAAFSGYPREMTRHWARITVGIGRPVARDAESVSAHVLRRLSGRERAAIEGSAAEILEQLVALEEQIEADAASGAEEADAVEEQRAAIDGARASRL
jgi:PTH1 family peptidyl-tRNA hydrolase